MLSVHGEVNWRGCMAKQGAKTITKGQVQGAANAKTVQVQAVRRVKRGLLKSTTEFKKVQTYQESKYKAKQFTGKMIPKLSASQVKQVIKRRDYQIKHNSDNKDVFAKALKNRGADIKKFPSDWRARIDHTDEMFSTSLTTVILSQLASDTTFMSDQDAVNNVGFIFDHIISTLRMPTHMTGMVDVDKNGTYYQMQHPTDFDKAMFDTINASESASNHQMLDRARQAFIISRMENTIQNGTYVEALLDGALAAIEYTLNYMAVPLVANNIKNIQRVHHNDVYIRLKQNERIEQNKNREKIKEAWYIISQIKNPHLLNPSPLSKAQQRGRDFVRSSLDVRRPREPSPPRPS